VLEYLRDGNATHAYIRAGYSRRGAQPSASRLLRQPHIDAAIAAGQQRIADALEVSVERLGREYAKIVPGHGHETVRCAGYAANLNSVAASDARALCSALI